MSTECHPVRRATCAWFLLVLFLLGTATPAVSRMTCLQSGHSELSVGYAEECCPDKAPAQGATVKPVCCEVLTAKPEKHPFAAHGNVEVPAPALDAFVPPVVPVEGTARSVKPRLEGVTAALHTRLASIGVFRL